MPYINSISYYLPKNSRSNENISEQFPEWAIDKIASKTGINERYISSPTEFSSDMACNAAEQLFKEHNIDRNCIDFLLLCTQSPDYFLPTTSCLLQNRLKIPTSVGAFDFNLGCSGFVYGLGIANGFIASGQAKNVLLITSETYSKFIHPKDKSNLTIFGDAAAAALITAEQGLCTMNSFVYGTDGSGAENLIVKQGGLRNPVQPSSQDFSDEYGNVRNDRNLYMNGSEIFNFTIESVPKLAEQVMQKANVSIDDIDLFVFHQANKYMLNHLRKKIGIPEERFFIYLEHCGNTVSSTIPIALYEAQKAGKIKPGSKVMLAGFGVGYSWAGCILDFS